MIDIVERPDDLVYSTSLFLPDHSFVDGTWLTFDEHCLPMRNMNRGNSLFSVSLSPLDIECERGNCLSSVDRWHGWCDFLLCTDMLQPLGMMKLKHPLFFQNQYPIYRKANVDSVASHLRIKKIISSDRQRCRQFRPMTSSCIEFLGMKVTSRRHSNSARRARNRWSVVKVKIPIHGDLSIPRPCCADALDLFLWCLNWCWDFNNELDHDRTTKGEKLDFVYWTAAVLARDRWMTEWTDFRTRDFAL